MIHYAFLQVLSPAENFPSTPFNLTLNKIRYQLPVPLTVSDYLAGLVGPYGPFRRLDCYCNTLGIEILRTQPEAFEPRSEDLTYAESTQCLRTDHGALTLHEIAIGNCGANAIERFAREGRILVEDAAEWIKQNAQFFNLCGGFVLARIEYCFAADDQDKIAHLVDETAKAAVSNSLTERHSRGMFRRMLETIEERP